MLPRVPVFIVAAFLQVCDGYTATLLPCRVVAGAVLMRQQAPLMCSGNTDRVHKASYAVYQAKDEDGVGFICFTELSAHFATLGYTAGAVEGIFDLLDVNRDGEISPAELRETFIKLDDAALLQALGLGKTESDAIFDAIDANGDGEITQTELEHYLEQQGHSRAIASSIFATLDENLDGAVSRDELHEGYTTYSGLRSLLGVAEPN